MNASLFAVVVFVWGLTWYAIRLQLGPVPAETSIFWRFLVASAIMWIGLAVAGRLKRVPLRAHLWFAALGAALFSGNFLFFYNAERFIASGVVSVVFAMASAFNVFNQWLFNGVRPTARTVLGALIGVAGVAFLFADQLAATAAAGGSALGLLLVARRNLLLLARQSRLAARGEGRRRPAQRDRPGDDLGRGDARRRRRRARPVVRAVDRARLCRRAPLSGGDRLGRSASSSISRWSPASVRSAPPIRPSCRR